MTALADHREGRMLTHQIGAARIVRRLVSAGSRVLDRASESGVAKLSAVSLALFGLVTAGAAARHHVAY